MLDSSCPLHSNLSLSSCPRPILLIYPVPVSTPSASYLSPSLLAQAVLVLLSRYPIPAPTFFPPYLVPSLLAQPICFSPSTPMTLSFVSPTHALSLSPLVLSHSLPPQAPHPISTCPHILFGSLFLALCPTAFAQLAPVLPSVPWLLIRSVSLPPHLLPSTPLVPNFSILA